MSRSRTEGAVHLVASIGALVGAIAAVPLSGELELFLVMLVAVVSGLVCFDTAMEPDWRSFAPWLLLSLAPAARTVPIVWSDLQSEDSGADERFNHLGILLFGLFVFVAIWSVSRPARQLGRYSTMYNNAVVIGSAVTMGLAGASVAFLYDPALGSTTTARLLESSTWAVVGGLLAAIALAASRPTALSMSLGTVLITASAITGLTAYAVAGAVIDIGWWAILFAGFAFAGGALPSADLGQRPARVRRTAAGVVVAVVMGLGAAAAAISARSDSDAWSPGWWSLGLVALFMLALAMASRTSEDELLDDTALAPPDIALANDALDEDLAARFAPESDAERRLASVFGPDSAAEARLASMLSTSDHGAGQSVPVASDAPFADLGPGVSTGDASLADLAPGVSTGDGPFADLAPVVPATDSFADPSFAELETTFSGANAFSAAAEVTAEADPSPTELLPAYPGEEMAPADAIPPEAPVPPAAAPPASVPPAEAVPQESPQPNWATDQPTEPLEAEPEPEVADPVLDPIGHVHHTDPSTGLLSAAGLQYSLAQAFAEPRNAGEVTLMMFMVRDLDEIEQRHGRLASAAITRSIAQRVPKLMPSGTGARFARSAYAVIFDGDLGDPKELVQHLAQVLLQLRAPVEPETTDSVFGHKIDVVAGMAQSYAGEPVVDFVKRANLGLARAAKTVEPTFVAMP